ncbi:F-box protein [Phanerochaete sordida]|uniref:F-box protein n=1 Tax=Phanerochaete sordida TaxID=48140 RepID=A0A9P3LFR1_9APHY|nr:F-box protein [Phanerochaete sordida]
MANTRLAAHLLPEELLLMIFEYYAGFDSDVFFAWTTVLFVCRFWNGVAMGSPKLWTKITSHRGLKCAEELLRRSGTLPLDIHIPLVGPDTLDTVRLLLTHAGRAKTLDLHLPYEYRDELKLSVSHIASFPRLQSLTLHATAELDDVHIDLANIFPHELPCLLELDIRADVDIHGMLHTPTLELLAIGHASSDDPSEAWCLDAPEIASALCSMPNLCELTVDNVRLYGAHTVETNAAEMPALRVLTLRGPAVDVADFCDILAVPLAASIALEVVLEDPSDANDLVFQASELFNRDGGHTRRMLRSLTVSNGRSMYDLVIEGSTTHADFLEPTEFLHEEPTDFRLSVVTSSGFNKRSANMADLAQFVDMIPLQGVHALNVIGFAAKNYLIPESFREIVDNMAAIAPNRIIHVDNFQANQAVGIHAASWPEMIPNLRKIQWSPFSRDRNMQ